MRLLKIARMGHPVLRQPAQPVGDPRDPAVRELIEDMLDTMMDAPGVGLAAPQVYRSLRILVYRDDSGERPVARALINPTVEPADDAVASGMEGCLSIPGLRGVVPRWEAIRVQAIDAAGRPLDFGAQGFEARVIQHEVDHLDGVLYLDRMHDLRSLAFDTEVHHLLDDNQEDD